MSYADQWEIFVVDDHKQKYAKLFYFVRGIWNVNSGITKIEKKGDNYLIYGISGSCYSCAADRYGIPENQKGGVYNKIANAEGVEFLENTEWVDFAILLSPDSLS